MVYYNCSFDNFKSIIVKASTEGNTASVSFGAEDEVLGSIKLPPFVEPEKFKAFELKIEKEIRGVHDLTIYLGKGANILSFKFVSKNDEEVIKTEAEAVSETENETETESEKEIDE